MSFARLLVVALLLAFLGAAFYAVRHRGPAGPPSGLDGLAALAPQSALGFLAVDLRGTTSTSTLLARLRDLLKDSPELQKRWQEAETKLGVKADDISRWSTPAAFLVILPAAAEDGKQSEKPRAGAVLGFPVTEVNLARADVQKVLSTQAPPVQKPVEADGFTLYGQAGYGFVGNILLVGSSLDALKQVAATCQGRAPNLTSVPAWKASRQGEPAQTGAVTFLPLDPLLTDGVRLAGAKLDKDTEAGLKAVRFFESELRQRGTELQISGLLGIDSQSESPFAKALLTPSNTSFVSARLVPAAWVSYSALDLHYLYNAVVAALRLFPETRGQVDIALMQAQVGLGFNVEEDVFGGFTGEVGYASNVKKLDDRAGLFIFPVKNSWPGWTSWQPGRRASRSVRSSSSRPRGSSRRSGRAIRRPFCWPTALRPRAW